MRSLHSTHPSNLICNFKLHGTVNKVCVVPLLNFCYAQTLLSSVFPCEGGTEIFLTLPPPGFRRSRFPFLYVVPRAHGDNFWKKL
ncbi:hypothetical protein SUGI_0288420 [Cryptomeria japonica]|nr:hypothetical protein SUGI_0288420 [Cryptomeria japonica]